MNDIESNIVVVICDGGSINNGRPNAKAYGSFRIMDGSRPIREEYAGYSTNNEAEILAITRALNYLFEKCKKPYDLCVHIRSDSELAVNCLSGKNKFRKRHLLRLGVDFWEISRKFKSVILEWHPRKFSVEALGH